MCHKRTQDTTQTGAAHPGIKVILWCKFISEMTEHFFLKRAICFVTLNIQFTDIIVLVAQIKNVPI